MILIFALAAVCTVLVIAGVFLALRQSATTGEPVNEQGRDAFDWYQAHPRAFPDMAAILADATWETLTPEERQFFAGIEARARETRRSE